MQYQDVYRKITEYCRDMSLNFQDRGVAIQKSLEKCYEDEILDHLDYAGIIPECYGHDSTEEKVFAKYCDALLARSLQLLSLKANVIEERGDAADVYAEGEDYTIVGDAKAFRLSRTAKNQKDFKVEALNSWKKGADFACLVGPLYQYPKSNSQIYSQAIRYNVTLLSYTHLAYLIRHKSNAKKPLKKIWEVTKNINVSKAANNYWDAIDEKLVEITNTKFEKWKKAINNSNARLPEQAKEHIAYWEQIKKEIEDKPREQLSAELIKALKINAKINIIKKTVGI